MSKLTINNFQQDYSRMLVANHHTNPEYLISFIDLHYSHIKDEVIAYLNEQHGPLVWGDLVCEREWMGQYPKYSTFRVVKTEGTVVLMTHIDSGEEVWDDYTNLIALSH